MLFSGFFIHKIPAHCSEKFALRMYNSAETDDAWEFRSRKDKFHKNRLTETMFLYT